MRILSVNANIPTIKQGEFNSSRVQILVPEDMRAYNLFLVFELPSGEKVFTPSILIDSKSMVSYPLPAAVLSELGTVQMELQGFVETSYIKSVTYSFQVVKSLTGPTNGTGTELKQEDYLPWFTNAVEIKEEVETLTNAYKLDEALRINKEIARVAGESARVIAENNRTTGENTRVTNEAIRVPAESGRTSAEGLRVTAESGRVTAEGLRVTAESGRTSAEGLRVTAESGRTSAEGLRVTAESGRAALLAAKADKIQEGWITPTLLNGWNNTAIVENAPKFRRNQFGVVEVIGTVGDVSTRPSIIFVLPVGYRPLQTKYYTGNSQDQPTSMRILTDGSVQIYGGGGGIWVSVDMNVQTV